MTDGGPAMGRSSRLAHRLRLGVLAGATLLGLAGGLPALPTAAAAPRTSGHGELQLCFVAGLGLRVGTTATFHATIGRSRLSTSLAASVGPTGTCDDLGTFALGRTTITETLPHGDSVEAITSNASGRSVDLRAARISGTLVAGTTTVTFADQDLPHDAHTGYLKVCKQISGDRAGAPASFDFIVNGETYVVRTGGCSAPIKVFAGNVTVTEVQVAGWGMAGCSTAPAGRLVSCTDDTSTAVTDVLRGTVSHPTTLTVTNGVAPPGAIEVVSDEEGYCALLVTTEVDCWGLNDQAQLGDGNLNNTATPTPVLAVGGVGDLSGVTNLVFDGSGFCALLSTQQIACWGYNNDGYVGNGTIGLPQTTPVIVVNPTNTGPLTNVVQISTDDETTCALTSAGSVYCWGYNGANELGPNYVRTPGCAQYNCEDTPVYVLSGVTTVSSSDGGTVGSESYCALLTTSGVDCWGGGFGVNPVTIVLASSSPLTGVTSIDNQGYETYCAILTSTGVDCWGNSYSVGIADPVAGVGGIGTLSGVLAISTGNGVAGETFPYDSTCVLVTGGGVDCWGDNTYGELGVGTSPGSSTDPVQVKGVGGVGLLSGATSLISTGQQLYCVTVGATSTVDCWGWTGEIEGSFNPYPSPVPVTIPSITGSGALEHVTQLTPDSNQSECVLTTLQTIDCWGETMDGQLGNASSLGSPPTQVTGIG